MTTIIDPVLRCIDNFVLLAEKEERGTSVVSAQEHRAAIMNIACLTRDLVAAEINNPRLTTPLIVGGWQEPSARRSPQSWEGRFEDENEGHYYTISLEHGLVIVKTDRIFEDVFSLQEADYYREEGMNLHMLFRNNQKNPTECITLARLFLFPNAEFPDIPAREMPQEAMAVYGAHFDAMKQCAEGMKAKSNYDRDQLRDAAKRAKEEATGAVVSHYQRTGEGIWVPQEGIVVGHLSYNGSIGGRSIPTKSDEVRLYSYGNLGVQKMFRENDSWVHYVVRVEDIKRYMTEKESRYLQNCEISPIQFTDCYENILRYFLKEFSGVTPTALNKFLFNEGKPMNLWNP